MSQMKWRLVHKELFITKMAAFALIIPLEIYDLGLSFSLSLSFFFFFFGLPALQVIVSSKQPVPQ